MSNKFQTVTIPAANGTNPGVVQVMSTGKVFATIASTGKFFVRPDNGESAEMSIGRYFGNPEGREFSKITLYNYTGVPNVVTFHFGNEMYKPDGSIASIVANVTTSGKNAATYTKGTAAAISGGGDVFNGVDGANPRKSFSIRNKEAAGSGNNISVRGANGTEIYHLVPQESFVVESGGLITIVGAAFTFAVCEVFYSP